MINLNSIKQQIKHALFAISLGIKLLGLALAIYCLAIVPFGGGAIAAPESAASIEMARAADQLDEMVGEGTSDQLQGKVQQDIGTVKREVGKVAGQVEGATDQVKGRAKEDIGRIEAVADNAEGTVEEVAEGLLDSIKGVFN